MPVFQTQVAPVKNDYLCDACGIGIMRATGQVLDTDPPKFPHLCTNCGDRQNFTVSYPFISYNDVT
jgi:hypothetical protein